MIKCFFYGKMSEDKRNIVFIAVNLDPFKTQDVDIEMPLADMGISPETPYKLDDLLLGHSWEWGWISPTSPINA